MKRIALAASAAVLALALAGCGSQAASSSAASSEPASSPAAASASAPAPSASASSAAQSTTTANWTEVKTAAEAAKGAGFEKFGVMDKITLDEMDFSDPTFAYTQGVAQATYESGAAGLVVRKAEGSHTATLTDRDTTEFSQTWPKSYEGLDVTCYGVAKGAATVVKWADGTKEYGVTFQGLGGEEISLDSDDVAALVKAIKEADGAEAAAAKSEESEEADDGLVAVPNVIGMDAEDAGAAIEAAGLSPDGDTQGTVVAQEPAAGTKVDPGDTVSISSQDSSDAEDAVEVPDVIGMAAASAAAAIEGAGLTPDGSTEGYVVDQTPAAGTMLDPGDTVSFGTDGVEDDDDDEGDDEDGSVEVPDVIGMDAQDAGAVIEGAGLSPDGSAEGVVVDQEPAPGTMVDPGDTVSIGTE